MRQPLKLTAMEKLTLKALFTEQDPKSLIDTVSFEDGIKLLEELVAKVESGSLALEMALTGYERGAVLVDHLKAHLKKAETRLQTLKLE